MDWGALVQITLGLYQKAAKELVEKISRTWWIGLLPLLYAPAFLLVSSFAGQLGIVGGFIVGFLLAVLVGSYLYFIEGAVQGNRMQPDELLDSWRPYFTSTLTILFFLFIIRLMIGMLSGPGTGTQIPWLITAVILPVLLSPVPEIIYQGHSQGFAIVQESVDFLRDSGVEWFVPLLGMSFVFSLVSPVSLLELFPAVAFPLSIPVTSPQMGYITFSVLNLFGLGNLGLLSLILASIMNGYLLFALMLFRGLLFRELGRSSRRQRLFRGRLN